MSHKHAVVVSKAPLDQMPPAMSAGLLLHRLGHRVSIVSTACAPSTRELLQQAGVAVHETGSRSGGTLLRKALQWRRFHSAAWRAIGALEPADLLWISGAETAIALGTRLARRKYVLQLNEIYDALPHYHYALRYWCRRAARVVVPEECRAALVRHWYGLRSHPAVLPNKFPLDGNHTVREIPAAITEELRRIAHAGKHILLYQGLLSRERPLVGLAAAVAGLADWQFVLMGPDFGILSEIRAVNSEVIHIPYIPHPDHMAVTTHARIGVVAYDFSSLNAIFCAPNKIWEFAGLGVPMLCNDVPGLTRTVGASGAGICVDFRDSAAVRQALCVLSEHHGQYATAALTMYQKTKPQVIMEDIIRSADV